MGSSNYNAIILQLELSYMMSGGHRLKISICGAHGELQCYLLYSRTSTWLVPVTIFGMTTALLYFAWLLGFPTWG
jgi:hypothetical protein